jgi:hypothetical protein
MIDMYTKKGKTEIMIEKKMATFDPYKQRMIILQQLVICFAVYLHFKEENTFLIFKQNLFLVAI